MEGYDSGAFLRELLPKVKEIALATKKVSVNTMNDA